jgi:HPt (histidine-containing phosphotransfer) domain-containing protein/microcompartment protein CcmK/EutM
MDASIEPRRILMTGVTSSTRRLVRHVLQSLGYQVDEAADGVTAGTADYLLVIAGARARHAGQPAVAGERVVPTILVGVATAPPDRPEVRACLVEPLEFGAFLATVRAVLDAEPAHARTEGDPVDVVRLHEFAGDDPDLSEELSVLYFATARNYLADMGRAVRDGADASRSAHSLKGASANFGAREVAVLALDAETHGITPERVAALAATLDRAEGFMNAHLAALRRPG